VDWTKVAAYADKGIGDGSAGAAFDVVVQGDNTNWFSLINFYGNENTWVRVDHRVINRMNPAVPAKFNGTVPPQGTSPDARYTSDFRYHGAVIGDPGRGIFMQSAWSHSRYAHHARTTPVTAGRTAVPYLLAAESDLVRAEALIRRSTPDLATAATLINKTRVGRGNLPPATAADGPAALLLYIDYERDVEVLNSSGTELFRRRHVNTGGFVAGEGLQPGTPRHLPIPARELETLALPIYTFGGVGSPDMYIAAPTGRILPLRYPEKRVLNRGPFRQ
jgi:hypothetical protein